MLQHVRPIKCYQHQLQSQTSKITYQKLNNEKPKFSTFQVVSFKNLKPYFYQTYVVPYVIKHFKYAIYIYFDDMHCIHAFCVL